MKVLPVLLLGAFVLCGCVTTKPNPEFSSCSNSCTKKQDACMVNASTSGDIARCNAALDKCVALCETKHPRYINR